MTDETQEVQTEVQEATPVATVFITRDRFMQIPTKLFGMIKSVNHKIIVWEDEFADHIRELIKKDPKLGITEDKSNNKFTGINPRDVEDENLRQFLAQKTARLPDSTSQQSATLNASSVADNTAKNSTGSHRFDTVEALKAKVLSQQQQSKPQE